jgi:phage-related minor tail protein
MTNDPTAPPDVAKQIHRQLLEAKQSLEIWQNDDQQWQAKEIEAQSQLRVEQARLNELQDTLDRLDKALANLSKQ